jgi:GTP-binding protein
MIRNYLMQRQNLLNTFVLIDIRLEPQTIDLELIRWLGTHQLPFSIVFTKSDKLSKTKLRESVDSYCQTLLEEWEELPPVFITSATTGAGQEEILQFILEANKVVND